MYIGGVFDGCGLFPKSFRLCACSMKHMVLLQCCKSRCFTSISSVFIIANKPVGVRMFYKTSAILLKVCLNTTVRYYSPCFTHFVCLPMNDVKFQH